MVTFPLFLVMAVLAVVYAKVRKGVGFAIFVGCLLGLTLASTEFGTPIMTYLQDFAQGISDTAKNYQSGTGK